MKTLSHTIRRAGARALLVPVLVLGCTDLTEVPSDALTPENAFQTEEEILAGVASVYARLRSTMWGYFNLSEVTTDEIIVPTRGSDWYDNGRWLEIYRQTWNANSGSALDDMNGTWNDLFSGVARSNLMISVLEQAGGSTPTASQKATIAELRVLRAWYYYMLQDFFGGVPLVTNTAVERRERVSRDSIFRFIESELTAAIADLPAKSATQYGRANKNVANAILASLYINAGVFTKRSDQISATAYNSCNGVTVAGGKNACQAAIDAANAVINSGDYQLASDWKSNFANNNDTSPENIFVIVHSSVSGLGMNLPMRTLHYNQLAPSPWNGFATIAETYNQFSAQDVRRGMWLVGQQFSFNTGQPVTDRTNNPLVFTVDIANPEQATEAEGPRYNKFPPLPGAADGDSHPNDYPFFRLAEMYLIRAEALNELNQGGAVTDINLVRARAFDPDQPIAAGGQAAMRDALLRERLFEFAGEGKRRQDLIRFGRFVEARRFKTAQQGHKVLFPIPETQIQANPLLCQNPGYGGETCPTS